MYMNQLKQTAELKGIKGNEKMLLEFNNFKTTYQAKKESHMNAPQIYEYLFNEYNDNARKQNAIVVKQVADKKAKESIKKAEKIVKVKEEQKKIKKEIKKEKKVDRSKKYPHKAMITANVMIVFKKKNPDGSSSVSKPYFATQTTQENILSALHLKQIIRDFSFEDYAKIQSLQNHTVVNLDIDMINKHKKAKVKQMMKKGYVLKNDWLKYSEGIANYAYDETEDRCVYYQLNKFLTNPPSGRPTKFINKMRTSEDALSSYFNILVKKEGWDEEYPDFSISSGVSTEMIAKLCKDINRSMYAYDEDNKCFSNVISTDKNHHYCPIIFYKLNGHFYIINDTEVMKSVAESNKETAKKIISSCLEDKKEEINIEVFHLESFDVVNALDMKAGIYLLQQSNLDKEIIEFITVYQSVPLTKNRENVIIKFTFKNENEEDVIIACDTNYSEGIEYEKMKHVAVNNKINYINEGVGSVICKVLENSSKQERQYLNQAEKEEFIKSFDFECQGCGMNCNEINDFEIDHIKPLSSGGSNDYDNLQPLCKSCHKEKTKNENQLGVYKVNDEISSCFNDTVNNHITNTSQFKSYQFVEKVNELPSGKTAFKIDMKKCRRNILLSSKFEFPVYSINDVPKKYSGEVRCGMFYINTENVYPFRGAGWYVEPLVKYGLENGLIVMTEILLEFIPYKTLPNEYFQKPINSLLDAFSCEPSLQKLCVNAYIGLMGKTCKTLSYSKFSLCPYEASYWYENSSKDVFIHNHILENGETLYEGIHSENIENEKTSYPIYSMVLQMEALELHRLESIIIKNGGYILDRNTDAIRYCAKKEVKIDDCFWSEGVAKYQTEDAKELKFEKLPRMKRMNNLDISVFDLPWNIQYDYESSAEDKAAEIINSNQSIHIDGRAGTGKTYLTNKVIDRLKEKEIKYLAFSPTNKGARLINGKTIHSMYYKFQHNKNMLLHSLENIEYIFIDEVSMMTENFYQLFNYIKRTFQKMKFIISGDFGQLPPVKDSWNGDYENSIAMWLLCGGNRVQLTKCRRSDDELFELCKSSNINAHQFKPTEKTYLNIAYTHKTRIRVNNECMERYLTETKKTFITIPMNDNDIKTQDIKLCAGMPVIAHITDKKLDILNSETFVVKSIDSKNITVCDDDRIVKVSIENFHKYFYLGFCITIYASQGETFDNKYTIYDWNFSHFCKKAKYVALSRATNIKNIQIGYNKCVDCDVDCKLYYRCLDCNLSRKGMHANTSSDCDENCYDDNNGDEDLYAQQA